MSKSHDPPPPADTESTIILHPPPRLSHIPAVNNDSRGVRCFCVSTENQ